MKLSVFFVICFVGLSTVSCQVFSNRERFARRMAKQCLKEEKLSLDVAVKLSTGDFSDDSKEAKCFMKCFAKKLKFLNEAGGYDKEKVIKYADLVIPENVPTLQIMTDCESKVVRTEDDCENVYQSYKCFWDEIKNLPEDTTDKTSIFTFIKALGFDKPQYDEEEDNEEKAE